MVRTWLLLVFSLVLSAQTATINWGTTYQSIDGFGGAPLDAGTTPLTSAQADFFFSQSGLGFSLARVRLFPSSACSPPACVAVTGGATIEAAVLANAQLAYARGAKIWATEWSPPASMKDSGVYSGGGNFLGTAANYAALAAAQASFVTLMTGTYGIPIYAISPQNEPDISTVYESCLWTAQQIHDYIPYLSAALAAAGYSSTKIMIDEDTNWQNNLTTTAMNDAAVAADVGIIAAHYYGGGYGNSINWGTSFSAANQRVWETEVSDFSTYDGSITSGLTYAAQIHQWLTVAQANAWHYWLLEGRNFNDNEALTDRYGNPAKRAYAMGNWAKFVRPGWVRIGTTYSGGLLISAFRDLPGANFAVVVVNSGSSALQTISLSGAPSFASVTPWITSSTYSLVAQSPVPISSGSWTYTIPASSIVTFVAGQSISAAGVTNAASYQPQISPGALATVFGAGFSSATTTADAPWPTSAGTVKVTVNGQPAPLYYVSPGQIDFQVPWETPVGMASIVVAVNGSLSNTVEVPVAAAGPGLFTNRDGSAAVRNYPDYSLNLPSNPASRGGIITAYLTGSGPVYPPVADGAVAPSTTLVQSTSSYSATVGSANAQVLFLGLAPGFVGLVQANIAIPLSLTPGTYPLTVWIDGQPSNAGTISVE